MDEAHAWVRTHSSTMFVGTLSFHKVSCVTVETHCMSVCRYWENDRVRLDYRPVHMNTLDDEVEVFPPRLVFIRGRPLSSSISRSSGYPPPNQSNILPSLSFE